MTQLAAVTYYRHSGRAPFGGLVGTLVIGGVAGVVLGGLYGYLTMHAAMSLGGKALGVVNVFACLIAAFVLAAIVARRLRSGHIRSVLVGAIASMIVTGVTLYAAWMIRLNALPPNPPGAAKPSLASLARPDVFADQMHTLHRRGIPGVKRPARGVLLTILWAAEAATFVVIGVYMARNRINENVYCENCRKWGTQRTLARLAPDDQAALKSTLGRGDFSRLEALPPAPGLSATELVLEGCPDCDSVQALTVNVTNEKIDPKSKETSLVTTTVIRRMNLSPEQIVELAGIAARAAPVDAGEDDDDTPDADGDRPEETVG